MALVLTIGVTDRTSVLRKDSLVIEQQAADFITTCSLTLFDANGDIIITAEDDITVVDGETYFGGRVVDINYSLSTKNSRFIHIRCQDLNYQLGETVIDSEEVYTAEADSDIIDNLFDTYLPAVDSETHVDTIQDPLTITFEPCTLRSALSQICTHSGGYFYIDVDNKLHYFSEEANAVAWWLSDDPDQVDSFSYLLRDPAMESTAVTRLDGVYVIGAGVEGWRGTHAPGDRQALVRDNRITTEAGRDARGDAILGKYGDPQVTHTVSTYKSGLRAGMDVRLINSLYGVDDTFTVRQMLIRWDRSGTPYFTLTLGSVVNPSLISERTWIDTLESALRPVSAPRLPTSSKGWAHNIVFSVSDNDTVAWAGAGVITLADGTAYTIDAGNTGNMAAITYIYFDLDTSETVLQTTTDSSVAVGSKKILIAVAENVADATKYATYQVFGGEGQSSLIVQGNIAALSVTTNEIAANTILAGNIAAGAIETDELAALAVTAAKIAANTITADKISMGIGDNLFSTADGLLLLGPNCEINPTEWWSARKQKATISGAFHQEAGRWPGTRGLVIEGAATNLCTNPSIEVDTTSWAVVGGGTIARSSDRSVKGDYSLKVTPGVGVWDGAHYTDLTLVNGEDYIASAWVLGAVGVPYFIGIWDTVAAAYVGSHTNFTGTGAWQKVYTVAGTAAGNNAARLRIQKNNDVSVAPYYIDGVQIEMTDYATSYLDGTLGTGYAWTGAVHNSTSTRAVTEVNLDAHIGLISSNTTLSFRAVIQAPYDADATWPDSASHIFDSSNAAGDRLRLCYAPGTDRFSVSIGAAIILSSALQTFKAGDWLDIIVTLDFAADDYNLYVNGMLDDNDATARTAQVATQWNLGSNYLNSAHGGFTIDEFAVLDRVLTAVEVAGMYAMTRHMVDMGSLDKPGIYILDGRFVLASSTSGVRSEIRPESIAIGNAPPTYDSGTGVWFGIDTDGVTKLFVGDDGGNKILWDGSTLTIAGEGSGVTNIDGGNIQANTITADEIAANAIETSELNALAVTGAKIAANAITADKIEMGIGDCLFNAADGILLLGPHCEIDTTQWWSTRRQKATVSGTLHQEAGRWLGTRGLVIEEATTNLIENPSFEVDTTTWEEFGSTISRDTTYSMFGEACLKIVTDNAGANEGVSGTVTSTTSASTEYTLTCYLRGEGTTRIFFFDTDLGYQMSSQITLTNTWTRHTLTRTFSTGVVRRIGTITAVQQDITFYCDGFQLEEQDYPTSYCDGSLGTGYAWTGVAHDSTSTRAATEVNLDAYAGLCSGKDTISVRIIAQMPYDYDAEWPTNFCRLFEVYEDVNNRFLVFYNAATNRMVAQYVEGGVSVSSLWNADFVAGDWLDIIATYDTAGDQKLYINGDLKDTDDLSARSSITPDQWNIGTDQLGTSIGGFVICEFAIFNRIVTEIETAGMYAMTKPMIDMGSLDKPGVYILDGKFKIASSTTGNRIDITADEIAGYDSGGTKQFYLQSSDGKAYAGAGAVILDSDGLRISGTGGVADNTRRIIFNYDAAGTEYLMSRYFGDWGGAGRAVTWVQSWCQAGDPWVASGCSIVLAAIDTNAGDDTRISIESSGLITVGGTQFQLAASTKIHLDGAEIEFDAATGDNLIEIVDNLPDALHISSNQPMEFMRFITSAGTEAISIDPDGIGIPLGLGMIPTANSMLSINLPTENYEVIDAGSAGATEQDWIKVEIGGVVGYVRVFAAA